MQKWILGSDAFANFEKVNAHLRDVTLKTAEKELDRKFEEYQPWMSSYDRRSVFVELSCIGKTKEAGFGPEGLELLGRLFSDGRKNNLKNILPEDKFRQVLSPASNKCSAFFQEVANCLSFIDTYAPVTSMYFRESIYHIIPLGAVSENTPLRKDGSGFSTQLYRGGLFLSAAEPSEVSFLENTLNLVHEMGHQVLDVYLNGDYLIENQDIHKSIYSVIRKTGRPAIMALHALMASAQMLCFLHESMSQLRTLVPNEYLRKRYMEIKDDVRLGINLLASIRMTPLGNELLEDIVFESHKGVF